MLEGRRLDLYLRPIIFCVTYAFNVRRAQVTPAALYYLILTLRTNLA